MLLSAVLLHASLQADLPLLTLGDWLAGKARTRPLPRTEWRDLGLVVTRPGEVPEVQDVETGLKVPLFKVSDLESAYSRRDVALNRKDRAPFYQDLVRIDEAGKQGLFVLGWGTGAELAVYEFGTHQLTVVDVEPGAKNYQFSPDGKKLAYVVGSDLWIADLGSSSKVATGTSNLSSSLRYDVLGRKLTRTGSETLLNGTLNWVYWEEIFGRRDIGYWWSPDSGAIAFLETDQSMIAPSYFTDPRQKNETVIKQYYPKAGTPNPRARVGVLEARTGDIGVPFSMPEPKWVGPDPSTYEYVLRVKWLPGSKELAILTMDRPQREVTMTIAPRVGGPGREVLKETDDAYVNVTDDLTFLKDGAEFLWASERTGYYHLYRYGIDGRLLNPVTSGDWNLVSNPGPLFWVRQSVSAVDERNQWVYFTTNKDDSIQRHLYRAKLDGSKQERLTTERGVHGVDFSSDGRYFVDRYSNLETPESLRLHDVVNGRKTTLAAADTTKRFRTGTTTRVSVTAADGIAMPGLVLLPPKFDKTKKYPVIMYCYGGPSAPNVQDRWRDAGWDQVLGTNGYIVFVFDNRSAMAVGKKQEAASLNRYMGVMELDDLVRAARWIKKQPYVNPSRVGLWGWSNGGTYTLLGMLRSDEFKAGIAGAAVVDPSLYDSKWAESMMKTLETNKEGYEEVRLDKYAKNLKGRLMLIHGTYDDNVHPQQLWRMADALIDANKQFDMMLYPMRKHGVGDEAGRRHMHQMMLDFWKRWL